METKKHKGSKSPEKALVVDGIRKTLGGSLCTVFDVLNEINTAERMKTIKESIEEKIARELQKNMNFKELLDLYSEVIKYQITRETQMKTLDSITTKNIAAPGQSKFEDDSDY